VQENPLVSSSVSIIVNNHNYGSYLRNAIDSALRQTYSPVEVIVVDDGSSDNSAEIIGSYGNRVVPVLKSCGGQASAFNAGFAVSHGDVIFFLDADDALRPGIVEQAAELFALDPTLAKVQYRMEVMDAAGAPTGVLKPYAHLPLRSGDLRRYVLSFPDDLTWTPTSGNAFSGRVLREILPMPEDVYGSVGADWYVVHLAPLFGPVCTLDQIGAYYRVHASNSYERPRESLDLDQIRITICYSAHTRRYIRDFAERLRIEGRPKNQADILSVSDVANRMTSWRLDSSRHPVAGDTRLRLFAAGVLAASRRSDVSVPMRLLFVAWFTLMAAAPRSFVPRLARLFFFPEARTALNGLLGRWHRPTPTHA
jgi:glycosyltransferase involved in cell wall biosynthesis